MTPATCEVGCAAPAEVLWSVVTDLPATAGVVPLTTAAGDPGPPGLGWSFAARTGLGPVGFVDEMLVTALEEPRDGHAGRVRVVKTGRVLDGWAEILVVPEGQRSRLVWREVVQPRSHVLRALAPARVSAALTHRLLGRMARDVVDRAERAAS